MYLLVVRRDSKSLRAGQCIVLLTSSDGPIKRMPVETGDTAKTSIEGLVRISISVRNKPGGKRVSWREANILSPSRSLSILPVAPYLRPRSPRFPIRILIGPRSPVPELTLSCKLTPRWISRTYCTVLGKGFGMYDTPRTTIRIHSKLSASVPHFKR
jgi:hypothetical protein